MIRSACFALPLTCLLASAYGCSEKPSNTSASFSSSARADAQAACSLLTADDIREVTAVAPGQFRFESNQCIWPAADGSDDFLVQMMVTPAVVRSYEDLAKQYREDLNTDPEKALHRIDGVGDLAVGFNEMPMVQVYTRSRMVQVSTFRHQEKHALELAKRAAGRLN